MPTGAVPPIHHDHADVRVIDQCIRERHPGRARADNQVVGCQLLDHVLIVTTPQPPVNNRQQTWMRRNRAAVPELRLKRTNG